MSGRLPSPAILVSGALAIGLVLAVLVVSYVKMRRSADHELCAGNLRLLYMAVRSGALPDDPRWEAAGTGRAFFANQDKWPTHQRRPLNLSCPVRNAPGEVDYRGPARPLHQMKNDEPILSDRPGNHGPEIGGHVCLRTGDIRRCAESDPLWIQAAQTTRD